MYYLEETVDLRSEKETYRKTLIKEGKKISPIIPY